MPDDKRSDKGETVNIPPEDEVSPESTYKRKLLDSNKPPKITGRKDDDDGEGRGR